MQVPAKTQQLLDRAKVRLITDHVFFASIVLRFPLTWTDQIPTAGITPRGHIYLNPEFIAPLNTQQVVFLLAHEAIHFMGMHAMRRGHREHRKWNYANDAVINDMLIDANVGEFIEHGVAIPGSRHKNSETVYNELPEQEGGDGGYGDHALDGDILPGDTPDVDGKPLSDAERSAIEAQVKMAVAQAVATAKMSGSGVPEPLRRFTDELLNVPTPWYDILERHFNNMKPEDTSWNRPNRRYVSMGMYLPGTNYTPAMGEVVMVVDTSGSIGNDEIKHFISHMVRIMEDCRPEKIHILSVDAVVRSAESFESVEEVEFNLKGGGGTQFEPAFDWVEESGLDPDLMVYLTDLCGDTNFKSPNYPVFWLCTTNQRASFGEVIKYEIL